MRPSDLTDRTWAEIDLEAVRANARTIMTKAAGARLLPMVKANAYGLGAVAVAKGLEPLDPWGFGVATSAEGLELRHAGIVRPILVVQPTIQMLRACAEHGLVPVLGGEAEVRAWLALGTLPFHIGVDTGMNRGGIWWEAFESASPVFSSAPGFDGIATHFHSAERDAASVRTQWQRFQSAIGTLPKRPAMVHAANSGAALGHPEVAGDLVRPGIFLYGGEVGAHKPKPVLTWKARVCRVAAREPGATVSYGATYRTESPSYITTVAAGYADGFRRSLANGSMLIGGRRHAVAGVVTMDFTMLTSADAPPDDAIATLIGTDGDETITLDQVAQSAGTISYEILTGLGHRVERIYT
jgi:alanine racemase